MDKKNKLGFLVLIPVAVGIALIISGVAASRSALTYAGIGVLFGGSFVVAFVISLTIVIGTVRNVKTEKKTARTTFWQRRGRACLRTDRPIRPIPSMLSNG